MEDDKNTPSDVQETQSSSQRSSNSSLAQDSTSSASVQHEHSDSLVTIRLSDAHSKDAQQEDTSKEDGNDIMIEANPRNSDASLQADSILSGDSDDDEAVASEIAEAREIKSAVAPRVSRVRFNTEELESSKEESEAQDGSENTTHLDEQISPSSKLSSNLSLSDSPLEDGTIFDSQLKQAASETRSQSTGSSGSESIHVDWTELDKNEEQEQRDEGTDESTAFLLARLEQENNALATNPKAGMARARARSASRPPSLQQLKKLVSEPTRPSLRYSLLPTPPPMTELEFWSALVRDYPQTAQRLPTLTSNKIRSGIPPPLRGVVWVSIAGARNNFLEDEYDRLCVEPSPYEKLIHKDVGRSYPGVDMFRDPDGAGQKMLSKVLNAFSLFDQEIGYCQGLGFVVGPLLMHMGDKEAFCVLVRLMEHYDLRTCFLPDLSGLHLRIYQFQHLLSQHLPELTTHLEKLNLEPLYLSQWFLSFFGVTCPLPMLIRIYDVILTEGASETLMRVALSLMRRNERKILATTEFEDVMQLLLSRGLWDTYGYNADELVNDFIGWTGLVTREGLQSLEMKFKDGQQTTAVTSKPSVHSAASKFLGRFWTAPPASPKALSNPSLAAPSRPFSHLRRTPSKQSMASTLSSIESQDSTQSAASTEATSISRQASADWQPQKPQVTHTSTPSVARTSQNKDKDLHSQIEDLLIAMSNMQREHSALASELQREREEREEERIVVRGVVENMKKLDRSVAHSTESQDISERPNSVALENTIHDLEAHFAQTFKRSSLSLTLQTKHQLREEVTYLKRQYSEETSRTLELTRQLTEREVETGALKDQLRDARSRIADAHREKQRMEKANRDLKGRKSTLLDLSLNTVTSPTETTSAPNSASGLREFKLNRTPSSHSRTPEATPTFSKRLSSLSTQAVLSTEDHRPANEDALLLELVNAKTAEAVARQELEEVKGKLESLRKLLGGTSSSPGSGAASNPSVSAAVIAASRKSPPSPVLSFAALKAAEKEKEKEKVATPATASGGGFFSGWGKRTVSGSG